MVYQIDEDLEDLGELLLETEGDDTSVLVVSNASEKGVKSAAEAAMKDQYRENTSPSKYAGSIITGLGLTEWGGDLKAPAGVILAYAGAHYLGTYIGKKPEVDVEKQEDLDRGINSKRTLYAVSSSNP